MGAAGSAALIAPGALWLAALGGCASSAPQLARAEPAQVVAAEAALRAERPEDALRLLEAAPDPVGFRGLRARQEALCRLARADEALAEARERVGRLGDADSHVLLARLLDDPGARAELEAALRLDPSHPWALLALAACTVRAGDLGAAAVLLDRALQSKAPPEALLLRAEVHDRLGRFETAAADYRGWLTEHPGDADARYNLATLLHRELRQERAAAAMYRLLLDLDAGDARALVALGALWAEQGEYPAAERAYLAAAEREPTAWFNLGLLYLHQLGRPQEARACLERFLEHDGLEVDVADRALYAPLLIEQIGRDAAQAEAGESGR